MSTFQPADLAVVIPTRDRWEVLARTLHGLRAQSTSGFAVVVVVDGSDQEVPDLGEDVTVVVKDHAGPGAARNTGVMAMDRPLVLLLGDDMIPAHDLVERHVSAHSQHPEPQVAVLGHVDWHPEVRRGRLQRWLEWSGTQFDFAGIGDGEAGAGRFYSSNVSFKRAFFLDVGGFDEDFPFVYEDIDLGLRLGDKGMRLLYLPEARTWHHHRYSWQAMKRRFAIVGSGEYVMSTKHPDLTPWFLDAMCRRRRVAPGSPWPWLVDILPPRPASLRRTAEERAHSWYLKHLTADFLRGWTAGAELSELRRYLGDRFDYPRLVGRSGNGPVRSNDDELYGATAAVMAGAYSGVVERVTARMPAGGRVLHYGCGTGSTGLHLLATGHDVTFVEPGGPLATYVRWRLDQRASTAPVVTTPELDGDLSLLGPSEHFDLALALDLERSANADAVLDSLGQRAAVVAARLGDPPVLVVARGAWRPGRIRLRQPHRRMLARLPARRLWPPEPRS